MDERFQIQDLIAQDTTGVIFKALDTEAGCTVALRRWFPRGINDGNLGDDERIAYEIMIKRLIGLRHPALRAIISGGCDSVDGIPFIVTDWIEGITLKQVVEDDQLESKFAVDLLNQMLEVCELLSHVLAEDAVWVETDLDAIVLGDDRSGRYFTFSVSPARWLTHGENSEGLEPIAKLTEQVMGWQGVVVNDQDANGLGAWFNWLRSAAPITTLREARENLAAAIGSEPPPAPSELLDEPPIPISKKSSKSIVFACVGLVLILSGLGGWLVTRKNQASELPAYRPPSNEGVGNTADRNLRTAVANPVVFAPRTAKPESDRVYQLQDGELLIQNEGSEVTLQGRLVAVRGSKNGKALYLDFTKKPQGKEPRAAFLIEKKSDIDASAFAPLLRKTIFVTGIVTLEKGRPVIVIHDETAIVPAPD